MTKQETNKKRDGIKNELTELIYDHSIGTGDLLAILRDIQNSLKLLIIGLEEGLNRSDENKGGQK